MKYWTMRDGRQIAIKDMETDHLANTVAMLDRNFENVMKHLPDLELRELIIGRELEPQDIWPVYGDLKAELSLRLAKLQNEKTEDKRSDTEIRGSLLELD